MAILNAPAIHQIHRIQNKYELRLVFILFVLLLAAPVKTFAFNKCIIAGKVTYQDAACPEKFETFAMIAKRNEENELIHLELDQLLAKGVGVKEHHSAFQLSSSIEKHPELFVQSRFAPVALTDQEAEKVRIGTNPGNSGSNRAADIERTTDQNNSNSAAALTAGLDAVKRACGGKLLDSPEVGMTDEMYIYCTIDSHVNYTDQIIVSKHGNIPIKLYVAHFRKKIYVINGVITKIGR